VPQLVVLPVIYQGRVKLLSAAAPAAKKVFFAIFCYFQVENGEGCVTKNI